MNKELKEQAIEIICNCRKGSMDDKQFKATVELQFDSLIDKTVQMTEGRIVGIIKNAQDNYYDLNSYETYAELESLKSRITNKSDIN